MTKRKLFGGLGALALVFLYTFGVAAAAFVPANKQSISIVGFTLPPESAGLKYEWGTDPLQQIGEGKYTEGNMKGYVANSCAPVQVTVENRSKEVGDILVTLLYDYYDSVENIIGTEDLELVGAKSGNIYDLQNPSNFNDFYLTGTSLGDLANISVDGVGAGDAQLEADVSGPYSGSGFGGTDPVTAGDAERHYNVLVKDVPAGGKYFVYYCGRLSGDAEGWNGSSMHLSVVPENNGVESLPIYQIGEAVTPLISVEKTANTYSYDAWNWDIDKEGSESSLILAPGQNHVIDYDVTVDPTTDGTVWSVDGIITVSNTSSDETYRLMSLEDLMDDGTVPTIEGCESSSEGEVGVPSVDTPVVMGPGDVVTCNYSAEDIEPNATENTATANVEGFDYSATAAVDFGNVTATYEQRCVTVNDNLYPGGVLGEVCADDDQVSFPYTFEYSYEVNASETGCENYQIGNTAVMMDGEHEIGSASWNVDVEVTCPEVPSACTLTQGYWKTHSTYGPAPYDENWATIGEDSGFYNSGVSYYEAMWTNPKKRSGQSKAYFHLAKQYIAAQLNINNGAADDSIEGVMADVVDFFGSNDQYGLSKKDENGLMQMASELEAFNSGKIGPGHCSE